MQKEHRCVVRLPAALVAVLILCNGGAGVAPGERQGSKNRQFEPYSKLRKRLLAAGWTETTEPLHGGPMAVSAILQDGHRHALKKGARLRFTSLVGLPPIDIPAGERKEIPYVWDVKGQVEIRFEQPDMDVVGLRLAPKRPTLRLAKDFATVGGYKASPLKDQARKWVFLIQKVELLEGERVSHCWYSGDFDVAVFSRKVKTP